VTVTFSPGWNPVASIPKLPPCSTSPVKLTSVSSGGAALFVVLAVADAVSEAELTTVAELVVSAVVVGAWVVVGSDVVGSDVVVDSDVVGVVELAAAAVTVSRPGA
jgi:hypothetical protein